MTTEGENAMNPDPTNEPVTARMIFTGVMLMCINDDKQCEVGMIRCPNHEPKITIRELTSGAQTKEYDLPWPTNHDLIFKVNRAEADGVDTHPDATGDYDFNKVIDLEGPDLHNGQVIVSTTLLNGRRLGLTSGKLYTYKPNDDEFDLLTWTDAKDPGTKVKTLGKTAEQVGLNIVCRNEPGSGIDILDNITGEIVTSLLTLADTTYEVEVNNDCARPEDETATNLAAPPTPTALIGTDFRFYYDVIRSQDGRKFDLKESVNPSAPPIPSPGICELAYLSKTRTLGFSWPKF